MGYSTALMEISTRAMGTQLNIKSDDAYALASRLAELTGESLSESVLRLAEDPELVRRTGELAFSLARLDAARVIVDEMMDIN